jgi:hypothetical protein
MSERHEAHVQFGIKIAPTTTGDRHERFTRFGITGTSPTNYGRHERHVLFEIVEGGAAAGGEAMMQQVDG